MEENKNVTIYDIPERLNWATSTISRALKGHHTFSDKTIKKVKKTAKEMGFVSNTLAAGLRGNKTKTIGVLIQTVTQPFLSSLISGIENYSPNIGQLYKIQKPFAISNGFFIDLDCRRKV